MRPQERSSLGTVSLADCVQCMQMSSINVSLDYDNTVMLTCKLLLDDCCCLLSSRYI